MTAPTNDFVVFDPNSNNIETQANYLTDTKRTNGFPSGIVTSLLANKIWRQGTAMAAVIGQFIANTTGISVADDGTTTTNIASLVLANKGYSGANQRPITSNPSTTSITVAVGGSGGIWLGTTLTKTTAGAWVAGGNQPGMGTSLTIAASTWYFVFLAIINGQPDVFFDTSVTGAHAPTGTTTIVRVGSFATDSSVHILQFVQVENRFKYSLPLTYVNGTVPGVTTAINLTIGVPPLANIEAELCGGVQDPSGGVSIYVSPLSITDVAASVATGANTATGSPTNIFGGFSNVYVAVNGSQQLRYRVSSTTTAVWLTVTGYRDNFI